MTAERPENGWVMVTNKLAQRIRELDQTIKLEMTERARLAERVEKLESIDSYLKQCILHVDADTTHDREGEQDG